MKDQFQFKVSDIVKRKHFEKAMILAGHEGINRMVKWVHIVEATSIRNLLKGHELILSTGIAWKEDKELFISLVEELIQQNAAGLCIEIDTYISEIPQEVIALANEHQFPIILFPEEVPFVEITQDIHTDIINQQYQKISNLENYSQRLNKRLLSVETYEDILQFIFSALDMQIVFFPKNQQPVFVPENSPEENQIILQEIEAAKQEPNSYIASAPIFLFGQEFAELSVYSKEIPISEYNLLILDRTATALAQHLLRDLYVEEKKRVEEFEWLQGWLEGDYSAAEIQNYLWDNRNKLRTNDGVVLITKLVHTKEKPLSDITYFKLLIRSVFEQNGFSVFSVEKRNEIILILLNHRGSKNLKNRIKKAIESILGSEFIKKQTSAQFLIAAGKVVEPLTEIHRSYQTAKETLRIQQKMTNRQTFQFYEDLHLYRLISQMSSQTDLQELLSEYLQPVIQYDLQYNAKLFETLKVYLECNGSKQETANRLFIVRQTLYHRLQKLENLLGADFMEHEKRVAIEFMLLVHEYLYASQPGTGLDAHSSIR